MFSALTRADSSASNRKASISASDKSEHDGDQAGASPSTEEPPAIPPPEEKDMTESHLFDLPGEEDHLEQNMPWLGVMTKLLNSFNYHCTHQTFCHPQCYRRQMRAARRMMEATRHVRMHTLPRQLFPVYFC